MKITRRDLMRGAGSFVSAVLFGGHAMGRARRVNLVSSPASKDVNIADAGPLSGARLYEDVILQPRRTSDRD